MSDMLPDQLTARFMRSIKNQFYKGHEKLFFQERNLLLQAVTWPARYLDERAVRISASRYQELLSTVIRTINAHGDLAQVNSPGRYLLHAVQEHMKHHGETYYNAAKATRNAIDDVLHGLKPRIPGAIQGLDNTVPALAEAHRVLSAAKGGRRKANAEPVQRDLFAIAKPVQSRRRDSGSQS